MARTWSEMEEFQPTVLKMIKNSIQKDRVAHAYIFEGQRGTGKKEAGLLLAKSLFCLAPFDGYKPCETCLNCKRINNGNHPDIHVIEPDGLSIKKSQIQSLQEEFTKTGVESRRKMYMIEHADRMTTNAANSLLKFLEEPHAETVAVLVTEQPQQMLPTILSRCQMISFTQLSPKNLADFLVEKGVKPEAAPLLAQLTNNPDEAFEISNNDWFAQAQKIVLKLYEALKNHSLEALVTLQEHWFGHFKEKDQVDRGLDLLLLMFKDLLYIQLGKRDQVVYLNEISRLEQFALQTSGRRLTEQMAAILEAKRKLHANMNSQLVMEELVLKLQEGSTLV
ncbi:DNA polymerase III subunit delta' [Bacillus sp. T33-2]|uniref:DNA polymerase III subunit delta' n=1 Tax=Bacillus sp. T33-2 TaxID=2054168 RepID=UPI000C75F534|nr:DNA polymerase III subunit delta' [Bacillus sp. T33-2]PLR93322.1 DNA polymerase III subunit delta' [Bacillus sp. T33-2]